MSKTKATGVCLPKYNVSEAAMRPGEDFGVTPMHTIRWKDNEPGAEGRSDVPEDIKRKYRFYYRDEKGNEFYVAKDYVPPMDVVCRIQYGMSFDELAQYVFRRLGGIYDEKKA